MYSLIAQATASDSIQIDWLEQLSQGGFVIVVQAALVIALIAICLERSFSLRKARFAPDGFAKKAVSGLTGGEGANGSTTEHTLGRVVDHLGGHEGEATGALNEIRDLAQREIEVEYEKLASLSLIAAAAPLLGLLGTMIGMIESFQLVALYGDEGGASMLAGSIAKALITTAVGLVIALPALFLHHLFKRSLQKITKVLEADMELIQRAWLKLRTAKDHDEG